MIYFMNFFLPHLLSMINFLLLSQLFSYLLSEVDQCVQKGVLATVLLLAHQDLAAQLLAEQVHPGYKVRLHPNFHYLYDA